MHARSPSREIEQNEFNLNLPRYIDSQISADIQDIAGHLQGGIPSSDVDSMERYWAVFPELRAQPVQGKPSADILICPSTKSTIDDHDP